MAYVCPMAQFGGSVWGTNMILTSLAGIALIALIVWLIIKIAKEVKKK